MNIVEPVDSDEGEAGRLLSQCLRLVLDCEFSQIWSEVLCPSPLVVGPPIQFDQGSRSEIRVPLRNGALLVFDLAARMVSLRARHRRTAYRDAA